MGYWHTTALLATILATSPACIGVLALWAATSPRHWLLRSAVVLAVLSPLLMVPAYEPWVVFALQIGVVVLGVKIRQWQVRRRDKRGEAPDQDAGNDRRFAVRFSLRALLAFTALVAMLTASAAPLARNMPQLAGSWTAITVCGVSGGCAVLIVAWMCTARRYWTAWLAATLLCLMCATPTARFDVLFTNVGYCYGYEFKIPPASAWFAVMPAFMACTWLLLRVWIGAAGLPVDKGGSAHRHNARRIAARGLFCLLLVALALPPAFVVWKLAGRLPIPHIPVPQPNGIDDIVAAGTALGASPILSTLVEPKSTEKLAAEVAKHAADYQRLHLGLTRDIRAHVWAKDGKTGRLDLGLGTKQVIRQAARALMREAELAQQQARYGDAARIGLDNLQLGQAVSRDGLLVDYLVGAAVAGMGNHSLYQALPQLDADECREMIAAVIEIECQREAVDAFLRRDRIWSEHAYGLLGHFLFVFSDALSTDVVYGGVRFSHAREAASTRLFIIELALRAYQLEHGTLPDRLEQLTPEFLMALPLDPFDPDSHPLRYVRADDGSIVYSVGADGKDDGGRAAARNAYGGYDKDCDGDLRLDVLFAPDDEEAGNAQPNE